ncbi:hypothetical protein CHS0354_038850, partial [Potamilus streckersoni]
VLHGVVKLLLYLLTEMATSLFKSDPYNKESEDGEWNIDWPADECFEAILENDLEKVKAKITEGFTALSRSSHGDMALHFACLNSKLDVLQLLKGTLKEGEINTVNIEEDDSICGTALHMSMDGQVDPLVVKILLSWGADPDALDAKGSPVLHELVYRAWDDFETAFESEAYMKSIRNSNIEEGYESMGSSYFEKLKLLHEYGADMNLVNSRTSLSPLHVWCQRFHWCMEKLLDNGVPEWCMHFLNHILQYGADVNAVNARECSPVAFMSQRYYKPDHTRFIDSYRKMLLLLLPKIININRGDMYGRTLLHISAEFSNYALIEELMKFHCDVNIPDKFHLSPLHIITHNITNDEHIFVQRILDILITNGANINIQDKHGSTPLHHAVHLKNYTAIHHLLLHGASVDIKDKYGRTVKDLAYIEDDREVFKNLGIVDQLRDNEFIVGVSDIRFGWLYPLCCYKTYSRDSRGIEEPEVVKDTDIDKWLEQYPVCIHNTKFILQNAIPSLETNMEQMICTARDAMSIKKEIYQLLKNVADRMGSQNPLFQSQIIIGGSVSEGTKIGSPDEMDFVFDLFKIRQIVEVVEDQHLIGFVKLKVLNQEKFFKCGLEDLVDEDGFLKRTMTSLIFHKNFEMCLQSNDAWGDSHIYSWWGTTNSHGECVNIGQLSLVWYGPFLKRQTVKVDIVPVFCVKEWQTAHINPNLRIVDKQTAMTAGCYLVMKDSTPFFDDFVWNILDDSKEQISTSVQGDSHFKLSMSQLEHATIKLLPTNIRNGYKIAKSVQILCPRLSYQVLEFNDMYSRVNVDECFTSFVIKTGLFHELDSQGILVKFKEYDLTPDTWNDSVIHFKDATRQGLDPNDITEAVSWALLIYKRLWTLLEENKQV